MPAILDQKEGKEKVKSEERDKKMEVLFINITSHQKEISKHKKRIESHQEIIESDFKLLAALCPGRIPEDVYHKDTIMRGMYDFGYDYCECGPVYCKLKECPMVQKNIRFDWEDGDEN